MPGPQPPDDTERTPPARDSLYAHLLLTAVALLWIALFFAIRFAVVAPGASPLRWDSGWYLSIAQRGYAFNGDISLSQNVAFLPALPLLERLALAIGIPAPAAVYVVCIACALGGVFLLHRALSARFAPLWSAAACSLLIASPFSLYFLNGYSESVYLLCLGAFFWALWRRNDLPLAALFAGLASGVRPYGLVLAGVWAVCVVIDARRNGRDAAWIGRRLLAYGPLCVVGFVATSLYFYAKFGDLFLYRNIMTAWSFDLLPSGAATLADRVRSTWLLISAYDVAYAKQPTHLARTIAWATPVIVIAAMRRIPLAATLYAVLLFAFLLIVAQAGADLGRHTSTNLALPLAIVALLWPPSDARPSWWRAGAIALVAIAAATMQARYMSDYFHGLWVS